MKEKTPNELVYLSVYKLLSLNNFNISSQEIKLKLNSHPEFPSVKAITDTLDDFKVENLAVKLPFNSIEKLPDQFLSVLKNGDIGLIIKKESKLFLETPLKKTKITHAQLEMNWTGAIIAIENSKGKKKILKNSKLIIFISISSLFFIITLYLNNSIKFIEILLISILGLVLSIYIIRKVLGIRDELIDKVCKTQSSKIDCNDVMVSNSSKLFGLISLGDLSLIYFSHTILILVLIGYNNLYFSVLSALSIPVIIYTLYQQKFKLNKWCTLCLFLSSVFILQISHSIFFIEEYSFDYIFTSKSLFLFFLISYAWSFLKPKIEEYFILKTDNIKFLKFKRNFSQFNTLLERRRFKKVRSYKVEKLVFGSQTPKVVIDVVISPTCKFCGESFKIYSDLLDNFNNNDLQINFIFNVSKNNSKAIIIAAKILSVYYNQGRKKCLEALKFWYDNENVNKWESLYNNESINYVKNIEKQADWCVENNINHVPVTLINNCFYPTQYELSDIFYFINDLKK